MEGPTPVSALIHAATMVTAGVYLIARMHPLFELAPTAADVGAVIGCLTLLVAGTIALAVTDLKRVIAYSTMSQIGYMVMAVSAGAYAAGLFHLMTHAFFKALLFMAAGSVIAAMAGKQNLDEMGGFRRAMPFTYGCMVIGGLALAGIPPFSGFFSKDEILLLIGDRGGWYWILYVAGYFGAFLTGVYTFRMIFRAFWGDPVPEAVELEEGHLHHAEVHTNPASGEVEDTDVGFPGPDHHIAEREPTMKIAMGTLAFLAIVGGLLQIPQVTHVVDHFLEPTFAESTLYERDPSGGLIAVRPAARARRRRRRDRPRVRPLGEEPRTARRGSARASAPSTRCSSTSGTSTSSSTRSSCGRRCGSARSPSRRSSGSSSTACSSGARPASPAARRPPCAPRRRASCATTPRCSSSAWSA